MTDIPTPPLTAFDILDMCQNPTMNNDNNEEYNQKDHQITSFASPLMDDDSSAAFSLFPDVQETQAQAIAMEANPWPSSTTDVMAAVFQSLQQQDESGSLSPQIYGLTTPDTSTSTSTSSKIQTNTRRSSRLSNISTSDSSSLNAPYIPRSPGTRQLHMSQQDLAIKRQQNTMAARRSRQKKLQHVTELETQVRQLQQQNRDLEQRERRWEKDRERLLSRNEFLQERVRELEQRLMK